MSNDSSFGDLIRRVRAGDDSAAAELVRLYEPHVRRAARIRMNQPHLRRLVDSMDICQSVLGRFFARAATGEFRLETPEQLIALLAKMAENRVFDWHRRQTALRRDRRRDVCLDQFPDMIVQNEFATGGSESADSESDASETLDRLMNHLPQLERRLAHSRLAGTSWSEIAAREGKSPDALRMQLRRAANKVLQELEHDD